jgi:hypothetical protein
MPRTRRVHNTMQRLHFMRQPRLMARTRRRHTQPQRRRTPRMQQWRSVVFDHERRPVKDSNWAGRLT